MERTLPPRWSNSGYAWLFAAFLIAATVLVGNWELLAGKAVPVWDAADAYAPMFSLVADHIKAARLMLWNPWIMCGSPDFADPQNGANSPILLLFALLFKNSFNGFISYWLSAWIFGGWGMLLLCRHLRCPVWGGLIVALGFVSCGFYTSHGQHTTLVYSYSFLPWILWRFDLGLARRSYWNIVEAGILWGLSGLGGYPALVILDPMFLSFWAAGRIWTSSDEPAVFAPRVKTSRLLLFAVVGLSLLGVVGVAILSPSYIGFVKFTKGYTFRSGFLDRQYAVGSNPLPPQALGTFASPYLYLLNWPEHPIWPASDISMSNIYFGVAVAALAVIAFSKRSKWRFWLGLVAVSFFSCSVGDHLPVRGWVYDFVPPTRFFRFPSLFAAYGTFACDVLAALATRDLSELHLSGQHSGRARYLVGVTLTAAMAGAAYILLLRIPHDVLFNPQLPTILFISLWTSLVIIVFLWSRKILPSRLLVIGLVLVATVDAGSALHISRRTVFSTLYQPWWNFISAHHVKSLDLKAKGFNRSLFPSPSIGSYRSNRNVVLKDSIFVGDTGMLNQYSSAYVSDPILNQLAVGTQRIWFSDRPVWLAPTESAFSLYSKASHQLGSPPLVLHTQEEMMRSTDPSFTARPTPENGIQSAQPLLPARVDLINYWPNTLTFRYSADRDGWLLVADRWAVGWNASINDRRVEVLGANFLFRAIPVHRGENVVRFHYSPHLYVTMLILSWGTLLCGAVGEILRVTVLRKALELHA